jgi:hypothetical protein
VGASIHRFPRAPSLAVLVEPGPVSGPANRFFIQLPLVNSFSTSFSCQIGIQHQPKPFGKENILTESGKALSAASRLWPRVHESARAKPLQDFQAKTPHAHARSRAPNRKMAQVGRTRLLQLPRGTGKPHESRCVSGSGACALVAYSSPPEPETPDQLDAHPSLGSAMASSTASAPSLS